MERQALRVIPELLEVFADHGLPLPPVPGVVLRFLEPVGPYSFSTHVSWTPVAGRYVVFELPPVDEELGVDTASIHGDIHFYCGVDGYGMQNWSFRYVLMSPTLTIGLVLPYGSAYGNAEKEKERIVQAYALIQSCLAITHSGESFGAYPQAHLRVTLDGDGFYFVLTAKDGTTIQEGRRLESFLDLLTIWGTPEDGGLQDWMRV